MKRLTATLLAGLLIAGCGGDDEEEETTSTEAGKPAPSEESAAVFESKEVGFTFEYPEDFAAQTKPDGQVIGQVSIEKGDALNAIKVRRTAEQELGTERYLDEFQRDFERSLAAGKEAAEVEKRVEKVGDLEVGILEFDDSYVDDGETVDFHSVSYFFAGGDKTWQLECISEPEQREQIDAACTQALESVEFSG